MRAGAGGVRFGGGDVSGLLMGHHVRVITLDRDLTDPELYRNGFPHELFIELRAQGAVLRHPKVALERAPDGIEFWAVLRHAEVQQANRDWETFSALSGPSIAGAPVEQQSHTLVTADPPNHTRLRKLISAGFTPRMIARLDERIVLWTTRILDDVAERGECDFVRDIAYLLPMHLIADIVGHPGGRSTLGLRPHRHPHACRRPAFGHQP